MSRVCIVYVDVRAYEVRVQRRDSELSWRGISSCKTPIMLIHLEPRKVFFAHYFDTVGYSNAGIVNAIFSTFLDTPQQNHDSQLLKFLFIHANTGLVIQS